MNKTLDDLESAAFHIIIEFLIGVLNIEFKIRK